MKGRAAVPLHFLRRLPLITLVLLSSLAGGAAGAQDARAILQKTVRAYQTATSYKGSAAVISRLLYKGRVIKDNSFTVAFRCRRPNRLMLDMSTPDGSREVFLDGQTMTVYDVSQNAYDHYPAAHDLRSAMGPLVTKAGVFAFLDPLYFIGQDRLPTELGDFKFKSASVWNGKPVYVVSGVTRIPEHIINNTLGQTLRVAAETRRWTWWIDRQTYLICQIESQAENIKFRVSRHEGNKTTQNTILTTSFTRHIVSNAQVNLPTTDSDFFFVKPDSARDRNPGRKN